MAAFFAMPEWKRLQKERGLFERIYDGAKRFVMPGTLAEGLIRYLSAGAFPGPKCTELMESLIRSLSTPRNCRELDYLCALEIPRLAPEKIDGGSADFWQYFLMRGFGYRHRAPINRSIISMRRPGHGRKFLRGLMRSRRALLLQ